MRRSTKWSIGGGREVTLDRTYIMGILNVTPDSFSDGGLFSAESSAVERAYEMVSQGADIIDIGGQSTRPGHTAVSPDEEWSRIEPVLKKLCGNINIPISVDTYSPYVAKNALKTGVEIINDVTGFCLPEMRRVAAEYKCGCVVMHSEQLDEGADVCGELIKFYGRRISECIADGISSERICLDPGIGFGKSHEQNLQIAASFGSLCPENYPMLAAASRKRVVGISCGEPAPEKRVSGTIAIHTACILGGAHIIRVHDIPEAVQSAKMADALLTQLK